jgi:adenylate kinase family enzyme
MGVVIFISGPSGVGKTAASKFLEDNTGVFVIHQDSYFLPNAQKPIVRLSDGREVKNWDTPFALDIEKFNNDIIKARFSQTRVIVEGFCLRPDIMKVVPDVHIHLSYIGSEMKEDICKNPLLIIQRMTESRKISKPDIKGDELMIKEIIVPFYLRTVEISKFDYIVPTFIGNNRIIDFDFVTHRVYEILLIK